MATQNVLQKLLSDLISALGVSGECFVGYTEGTFTELLEVKIADPIHVGKVIGKDGRNIDSLRNIFSAIASRDGKKAIIVLVGNKRFVDRPRKFPREDEETAEQTVSQLISERTSLLHTVCGMLVGDQEKATVTPEFNEDLNEIIYTIRVPPPQVGRVIGRKGNVIMALRTLFSAIYAKNRIKAEVRIDERLLETQNSSRQDNLDDDLDDDDFDDDPSKTDPNL